MSPDTIVPDPENVLAYNRYMYTLGNPLKYSDPSGNCSAMPGVGYSGDYSGDDYEDGCDENWEIYAYGKHPPSLFEKLAPDVVIYGWEAEGSVIATMSGGRYTVYDFENLRKYDVGGLGGGISLPSVSGQYVNGIGYYASNDPVFKDPNTAVQGKAVEGSLSAGEGIIVSGTYGSTGRYVDKLEQTLKYVKTGLGLGAGAPVNVSIQGVRSNVISAQEYRNIESMTSDFLKERSSGGYLPDFEDAIGFMQRFRQREE